MCACEHLFILVGRDCDELRLLEGDVGNQAVLRAHAHDVELRLVLVQGVEHDLKADKTRCVTHIHPDTHLDTHLDTPGHT